MGAPFPLTPVPGYFTHAHGPRCNNVFYAGDALTFTLDQSGANSYTVRDWTGATIVTGAVSGTSLTLATPGGGWVYGWYRLYLTGVSTDSVFGPSYGATNFAILRTNANFPTAPAYGTAPPSASEAQFADRIAGGVFGFPVRWSQGTQSGAGAGTEAATIKVQIDADTYWTGYTDAARPRDQMVAFNGATYDQLHLVGGAGDDLYVYVKDGTVNGSTTFVQVDPGSVSGTKITVRSPNSSTVVETYDNLAGGGATLMAALNGSAYIRAFAFNSGAGPLTTRAATAIGNANFQGVVTTVAAIYPSATWFEGPLNEPEAQLPKSEVAHWMHLFHDAVKQGNAAAKVLGPGFVAVTSVGGSGELFRNTQYMDSGGLTYLDGYSFHTYNSVNGQVTVGRANLAALQSALSTRGAGALTLWQTELGADFTNVYGVYHPRRARWRIMSILFHEQYGVAKERNLVFNDTSHGFWGHPSWYINGTGGSPNPQAVMMRTLNEELWGKTFSSAYTFGAAGDSVYLAQKYAGGDGTSVAVLMATTAQPAGSLTFQVTGTGTPTVFDCWGNAVSSTVTRGELVIAVSDTPVYVRLPAGVALVPLKWNDWPSIGDSTLDREFGAFYSQTVTLTDPTQTAALPQTGTLTWTTATNIDRVLVVAGNAFQNNSTFLTFTVDTYDGSSWTTRVTVTEATPTSFQHGDDSQGCGTQRETFWAERWIWDLKLPAIIPAKGVRVSVTAASYGGEPDAACVTTGGQGNATPAMFLSTLGVYANHTASKRFFTGTASG